MDREVWRAVLHAVAESQIGLSDWAHTSLAHDSIGWVDGWMNGWLRYSQYSYTAADTVSALSIWTLYAKGCLFPIPASLSLRAFIWPGEHIRPGSQKRRVNNILEVHHRLWMGTWWINSPASLHLRVTEACLHGCMATQLPSVVTAW